MKIEIAEHRTLSKSTISESIILTDFSVCDFVAIKYEKMFFSNIEITSAYSVLTNITADSLICTSMIYSHFVVSNPDVITTKIANDFHLKILHLNNIGKIHESLKESYKIFDQIFRIHNIELAEKILINKGIENLPIPVIISLLNSTTKFKSILKNREDVYKMLQKKMIEQMGEEKFLNSLYYRLK